MKYLCCAIYLVALALNAEAFVSRLHPMDGGEGPIPCKSMEAALLLYIGGTYTGAQLANALEARYLTPIGLSWSAEDTTDNTNIKALVDAATGTASKTLVALKVASICIGWEDEFAVFDTDPKNVYRTLLGIATQ